MAKDIIVSINVANGEIYTNSSLLGVSGENVEGQIIVEFFNGDFVDGACNFEIEKADGTKGYLAMAKDTASKIYRLDISANLLSVVGKLKAQVHITQIKKGAEIPVFKSQVFTLDVLDALNTAETIPADKAEWCDKVDEKLEALDKSISEMPNDFFEKPTDNPTEDSLLKVSPTGGTSWKPVSDFLAVPDSAANSDRVCIVPDGQTKFGYKNAYKTVYNVENVFVLRDTRGTVPQPDPQRGQDGVNLRYLQNNYNANPTLDGTETELTGVTLNGVKYKVPSGGSDNALIKPEGNPTVDSVVKVDATGKTTYLGIDSKAKSGSKNLVTSGAVAAVESSLSQSIAGCATEPDISTFPENDDAFFIGEKTSLASKWLPKKQMTLKSHKIHFEAFDSGSKTGQFDDAFISVLCYTETPFTVETLTTFMLATGQSYPVCSPSYGMVGYVRVSNAAGEITWEDKEGNNITLAGINANSYVLTDIQSFFPFDE